MSRPLRGRVTEPSSWGGIGGVLLSFASVPSSVIPDIPVIPWQLRVIAFVAAIICFAVQVAMREWPNK